MHSQSGVIETLTREALFEEEEQQASSIPVRSYPPIQCGFVTTVTILVLLVQVLQLFERRHIADRFKGRKVVLHYIGD